MTELIELVFVEISEQYDDHTSWNQTDYQRIGIFDNLEDVKNLIISRIDKYHTNHDSYLMRMININQSDIDSTRGETIIMQKFEQIEEQTKQKKLDDNTEGFKCSECKKLIKSFGVNSIQFKSRHAQTHIKNGSWSHVNFLRVMRKTN